tara:strand:+ start:458 stop:799 length:342 start_codon:yes stop_codon:yes gene_type:complete
MDSKLEKALEFANFSQTLQNQKNILLKQYQDNCYHYQDGCAFEVTPDLITFCNFILSKDKPLVLLDSNCTPVEINNPKQFIDDIVDVYIQSTNKYLIAYNKFKSNKKVKGLLD